MPQPASWFPLHVSYAEDFQSSTSVSARVLGCLETFGATLALIWLLTARPAAHVDVAAVAICVAGAYAVGFSVLTWCRLPSLRTIEALVSFTIVGLISVASHFGGSAGSAIFSLFYVLAALYAFSFLAPRRALLQGGLIAVSYAVVLIIGTDLPSVGQRITGWLFVVGISFCSGLLLLALSEGLRRSERRFREAFERHPQPMWIHDCETLRFLDVNQRAVDAYGYPRAEFLGMTIEDIRPAEDRPGLWEALNRGPDTGVDLLRHVKESGEVIDVEVLANDVDFAGRPARLVVAVDVTSRLQAERLLRRHADHDALTGLFNRRRLQREIDLMLSRGGGRHACALVVLDIDHFKLVNDSFGHTRGDELVRRIADVLTGSLRDGHVLGRLGGDEFAIAVPNVSEREACEVAQELLNCVKKNAVEGRHHVTASAGIAVVQGGRDPTSPAHQVSAEDLLIAADIALYQAKDGGRDRFAVAGDIKRGHTWIDEVRAALYEDRLVLYAQPIIDLSTGATVREELLIRMLSPDGDVIPPASFIPTAERFGLINEIDRWVVGEALELARGGRPLQINISARSFGDPQITQAVSEAVGQGVDPSNIVFEITETAAVSNYREASDFAERLSRAGCGLALDDFGTGFGTLSYLKHIPFNYLKIDMDFVRQLTREPVSQRIVKVIVRTARELGQKTIAEGVENATSLPILQGLGVDMAQGYHLGPPMPIERATAPAT